jgi:hypothetical protein
MHLAFWKINELESTWNMCDILGFEVSMNDANFVEIPYQPIDLCSVEKFHHCDTNNHWYSPLWNIKIVPSTEGTITEFKN